MSEKESKEHKGLLDRLGGNQAANLELQQSLVNLEQMQVQLRIDRQRMEEAERTREHALARDKAKRLPSVSILATALITSAFMAFGSIALEPVVGHWPAWAGFFFGSFCIGVCICVFILIQMDRQRRAGR